MTRRWEGVGLGAGLGAAAMLLGATLVPIHAARSADSSGLLDTIRRHITRTTTVTANGDLNPYAVVVVPVAAGKIQRGDVLVDNFNNMSNFQGTGTTIISYRPSTKTTTLFAKLPQNIAQCPGGIGLTTAMMMLKSGWIIVGSTPSGTTQS
jgi:hypothetical protein